MYCRYETDNLDCEAFVLARRRANVFFKYHKKRLLAEYTDLHQEAMLAVVELAATIDNKSQIPDDKILHAVDSKLHQIIKSDVKESPIISVEHNNTDLSEEETLLDDMPRVLSDEAVKRLQQFRRYLLLVLGKEKTEILLDYYTCGLSIPALVAKLNANGHDYTERRMRNIINQIKVKLQVKLSPAVVNEILNIKLVDENNSG